jgi:hypothetical protein
MSTIEFALVRFGAITAAEKAFADARNRSSQTHRGSTKSTSWNINTTGSGVLRGTFAGHYIDVDEALHVSERGGAQGFAAGAALGALLAPPASPREWFSERSERPMAPPIVPPAPFSMRRREADRPTP